MEHLKAIAYSEEVGNDASRSRGILPHSLETLNPEDYRRSPRIVFGGHYTAVPTEIASVGSNTGRAILGQMVG